MVDDELILCVMTVSRIHDGTVKMYKMSVGL